jgi:hypothetical protein
MWGVGLIRQSHFSVFYPFGEVPIVLVLDGLRVILNSYSFTAFALIHLDPLTSMKRKFFVIINENVMWCSREARTRVRGC